MEMNEYINKYKEIFDSAGHLSTYYKEEELQKEDPLTLEFNEEEIQLFSKYFQESILALDAMITLKDFDLEDLSLILIKLKQIAKHFISVDKEIDDKEKNPPEVSYILQELIKGYLYAK